MFKTLWEIAVTEKKLGRGHYEHREKNLAMALEFTEAARQAKSVSPTIARRRERWSRKLALAQRRLL